MQRLRPREAGDLDLRPPARLDLWALVLASGIVLGTVATPMGWALVVAAVIVCGAALVRRDFVPEGWRPMAVLAPLFAAAGVGIATLHAATPDPLADLAVLEPGEVTIAGQVASPVVPGGFGNRTELRVEHLWYDDREVLRGGGVQVFAGDLVAGVGDRVIVEGEISVPEAGDSGFDYARYLSTRGISAVMYADGIRPADAGTGWIGEVHRRTDVALSYGLRPTEASIVRGIVLGDRSQMSEELEEAFRRVGITHILAISGQHVAILAAMVFFVLRFAAVPVAVRSPVTLGVVWLYTIIAGAPPSAIRAAVVATLVLSAPLFGRQLSPLHFMTVMLAAVLAYNPALVYSTGFQLSVAAVFGILLLRKPLEAFLKATLLRPFEKPPELLTNLLSISLAAQIATAPIVAATFGEVSIIGVLTNLVAVPLSGPILTLGLLGAIVGNVAPVLAYPINFCNGFLVTIIEWIALVAAPLPFAAVTTPTAGLPLIAAFYAGCIPAAIAGATLSEERQPLWAGLLVVWTAAWLTLMSFAG